MASSTTMAGDEAEASPAAVRLRCWGDFALADARSGADLKPRGRKSRALLAYLALHPGRPVSRERLTGLLWGDRADQQARGSLRQSLFELKALTTGDHQLLIVSRDGVSVAPGALTTDTDAMRDAAARGDYQALLDALPDRDERLFATLDDIDEGFDDWLAIERARQSDMLTASIADAATAAAADGSLRLAEALGARLRERDPDSSPPLIAPVAPEPARVAAANSAVQPRAAPQPESGRQGQRWRIALLVALLLTASLLAIGAWRFGADPVRPPTRVAVLAFKDLSGRDSAYFAEGVSEEILGQLARNPQLQVMGRTSAFSFKDRSLDAPTLGRKLGVDYLIEGSVRSAGSNVRVSVSLVRAGDGAQLWTERFDGRLDDIFAIQDRIGAAVTTRLRGGPDQAAQAAAPPTRGDVYALYITARGLIRDREEAKMDTAVELLRRAVKLDPGFAPAWASLGAATHLRALSHDGGANALSSQREALGYTRRALALDPKLAEAHFALGLVLAPAAQAKQHIERAVALDPNNAEFWNLLAQLHGRDGSFQQSLDAWRRAVAIDPLWWQAFYNAAEVAWDMGHREEAARYVRRVEQDGIPAPFQPHMVRGDMAWRRNDFSGQFAHGRAAWRTADAGRRFFAELAMGRAFHAAGLYDQARPIWRHYRLDDMMWRMWRGDPPTAAEVRAVSPDPRHTWDDTVQINFMLRTLVRARRFAEAASLYDRSFKSPEAFVGEPLVSHHEFVANAPLIATALHQVGRSAEADQLLAMAQAAVTRRLRQGAAPLWYHADTAMLWAVTGARDAALAALERAVRLGWMYRDVHSFPDIADEPAFASLRGHPRFERLRTTFRQHVERERGEITALLSRSETARGFNHPITTR